MTQPQEPTNDELEFEGYDGEELEDFEPQIPEYLEKELAKRFEATRREAEQAVIQELASGNADSPVYKGLQRVISKKDQEIYELRDAVNKLYDMAQQSGAGVGFLASQFQDILDEDGKKIFEQRRQEYAGRIRLSQLEQQQRAAMAAPPPEPVLDEQTKAQINEYRNQATEQLKKMARAAGVDPDDKRLDYGSTEESLLERMGKFNASVEQIRGGPEVQQARRRPSTIPTGGNPGPRELGEPEGRDLLYRASQEMIKKMRAGR